jgi:hypothetical protein
MGDAIAQALDGAPSRSTSLLAVASSVAKEPNSCRLLSLNSEARAGKCSRSTANTSARLVQGWATEAVMAGTIMQATKLPLTSWFLAFYLIGQAGCN